MAPARTRAALALVAAGALAAVACSRPTAARSPSPPRSRPVAPTPFAAPSHLTATLSDASTISLAWRHHATEPAGYWVEWSTPGADFVKLEVAWPPRTAFSHREVAPATTSIYRVVPFFGRPSAEVALRTGPASRGAAPSGSEGPLEDPGSMGGARATSSLRSVSTIAAAAPSHLRIALATPASAELRWEDRASDEDGYLVELAREGDLGGFQVCALLPPDATSFRKVALPPDSTVRFRVRAFFEGAPSKRVLLTTPAEVARAQR